MGTWKSEAAIAVMTIAAAPAFAQDASPADADALAKQLSNSVAALISVPFQLNYGSGYDNGGERWQLNIQPVIPVSIGEDWNILGGQMASIAGGARAYLDKPDGGPDWGLRLAFTLLFPGK